MRRSIKDSIKYDWISNLLYAETHNINEIHQTIDNREIKGRVIYKGKYLVYFASTVWYHFVKYIVCDKIFNEENEDAYYKEHILVDFGRYQPTAKSIVDYKNHINSKSKNTKFKEVIEFANINDLPSTKVMIEDMIEIMYDSTINNKSANINSKDTELQLKKALLSNVYNELFKATDSNDTECVTFSSLYNYNIYSYLSNNIGVNCDTLAKKNNNDERSYIDKCCGYVYKINDYIPTIIDSKVNANELLDNNINHIKDKNSTEDDNMVLLIAHGIQIGKLLDTSYFKRRDYNFIIDDNRRIISDMHHNSVELDNHWEYNNNYTGRVNKESVDDIFESPEITDRNEEALNLHNLHIKKCSLSISHESELENTINCANSKLKNKLLNQSDRIKLEVTYYNNCTRIFKLMAEDYIKQQNTNTRRSKQHEDAIRDQQ